MTSRSTALKRTLGVVLALNVVVFLVKAGIAIEARSLTVAGAALESALDMVTNLLGMSLLALSTQGPDENHPYGHAKFETLGSLAIVGFLSISCFELFRVGVTALISDGGRHGGSVTDVVALACTLPMNGFIVAHERRQGRALNSAYLIADASHTQSDVLVTLLGLVSLWLASRGLGRWDGALALVVALLIAWNGFHILELSIPVLVDARAVDSNDLAAVVARLPDVRDVRGVRSRRTAAGQLFVEVTIGVTGSTSVERAHILADQTEDAIRERFGDAQVTVHVEPS